MNNVGKLISFILFSVIFINDAFASPDVYPVKPAKNQYVVGVGLGLESGLLGIRVSRWIKEPNIIFNFAFGLEGFSPVVRLPLVNVGNYDLYFDMASLFTPGALGVITGDDGGILFSKDTFLLGGGFGIQRWLRKKNGYGLYLSAGMTYWVQIIGEHEGSGSGDSTVGWSPEFQIGVVY